MAEVIRRPDQKTAYQLDLQELRTFHGKHSVAHNTNRLLCPTPATTEVLMDKLRRPDWNPEESSDFEFTANGHSVFCDDDDGLVAGKKELQTLFLRMVDNALKKHEKNPAMSPEEGFAGLYYHDDKIGDGRGDETKADHLEIIALDPLKIRFMTAAMQPHFPDGRSVWGVLREVIEIPTSKYPSKEGLPVFIHEGHGDEAATYFCPWSRRLAIYRMLAMLGRCNTVLCRVERKTRAGWKEKLTTTSHGALCSILGTDEYIGYNFGKTKFTIMVGHSWRMEVDSKLAKWCTGQMVDAPGQGPVGQVTLMDAHMEQAGGHDPEHSRNVVIVFRVETLVGNKSYTDALGTAGGLIIVQDTDDEPSNMSAVDALSVNLPCVTIKATVGKMIVECIRAGEKVSVVHVRNTNCLMLFGTGAPSRSELSKAQGTAENMKELLLEHRLKAQREASVVLEHGRMKSQLRSLAVQADFVKSQIKACQDVRNQQKEDEKAAQKSRDEGLPPALERESPDRLNTTLATQATGDEEDLDDSLAYVQQVARVARLEAERKYNNKAGSRNELQAMMQRRKLRGTILAVDALAQEKIADYFAPTVTHSSFGRDGSFAIVHEGGHVDYTGLEEHISSKLPKLVTDTNKVRYISMSCYEDWYFILYKDGTASMNAGASLTKCLNQSYVAAERVIFGPAQSWLVLWPGGVCDWSGLPAAMDAVLRENNYQKRRPVAEVAVGAPDPTQGDPATAASDGRDEEDTWSWFVMFQDGWFCSDNLPPSLNLALENVNAANCVTRNILLGDQGQWMLRYSPLAQQDDRAVEEIPIQERLQAEQAKLQSQRRDSSTMRKRLYHGSPQLPHGLTYGYA